MFTLVIFCLTTSNLPWFMDLTFQVPMQYSLQHQTWLPSPVTSTAGCCFCFGSVSSFFLELVLRYFPVAYWAPTKLGSSSLSVLSFCLFILFMGFSRQEYWSGFPFPSFAHLSLNILNDYEIFYIDNIKIFCETTTHFKSNNISQLYSLSSHRGNHYCKVEFSVTEG